MMEKFQTVHTFLKEMWLGFINVANLEEFENPYQKRLDTGFRFQGPGGIRKLLSLHTRELEDGSVANLGARSPTYCDEIDQNKEIIKTMVLNYVDHIVNLYLRVSLLLVSYLFSLTFNRSSNIQFLSNQIFLFC